MESRNSRAGDRDRISTAILALGVLAAVVGCTARGSSGATEAPQSLVTVVMRIQQIGPTGTTPAQAKQAASAVDCRVNDPQAPVPAGRTYLVRLKIDTAHLTDSLEALSAFHDVVDVHTESVASFSATPTEAGPGGATSC